MKHIRSLLAVVQLLAICQILFGLLFASYNHKSGEEAILRQITDDHLSRNVAAWHQRTVETTRVWSVCVGTVSFLLIAGVALSLRRHQILSQLTRHDPHA